MTSGRGPGVDVPPPIFLVAGFVAGWALERFTISLWPAMTGRAEVLAQTAGIVLLLSGLALAFWGIATFHRWRTAIFPNQDATMLVKSGPYRLTRNPMYSGLTVAYVGMCLLATIGWALVTLPLALIALTTFVIRREERYLAAAFGDEYRRYQSQVGRWF